MYYRLFTELENLPIITFVPTFFLIKFIYKLKKKKPDNIRQECDKYPCDKLLRPFFLL